MQFEPIDVQDMFMDVSRLLHLSCE